MRWSAVLLASLLIPVAAGHDEGMAYDPAAAAGLFPDPTEVQQSLLDAESHPWVDLQVVGYSQDGLPLRMAIITDPESAIPMEDRVVTFIMSQQHGNEPAGTPAAIRILEEITSGTGVSTYLHNQILLLLPQSNPDGAIDDRRTNEAGTDINRDHVALSSPEARALHEVLNQYDVHMAMDHHEYGGIGAGYPSPVRVYDWDITTMLPNHGNVQTVVADMAARLNYEHLYPRAQAAGYTIGDYGWQGVGVSNVPGQGNVYVPLQQTAGGPDPGILRNNYGLNNVVGLLVETFVQPAENPLNSFDRRVGAHHNVMTAVLEFGAMHADELRDTKREAERANREDGQAEYIEGDVRAPLAQAYWASDALLNITRGHGLPLAIPADDGYVFHLDHARLGLVAAMLHPSSSRHVIAAEAHDPVILEATPEHRDYGTAVEPVLEASEPPAEQAPGLPLVLALLALVLLARRRSG